MLDKLQKQIDDAKKIIEVLPENNKENRSKKNDYLMEEEMKSLGLLTAITKELQLRGSKYDSLVANKNLDTLKLELDKCNVMEDWNTYNNAYEKTHLDYYLYQLHRYQQKDLSEVNHCITQIIDIFKSVGINITATDLNYHPYITKYITMIQNNYSDEELTKVFEQFYWKLPEIIKAIELNFKSIFLKNEKKIDKYYEEKHKKYLEHHTDGELIARKEKIIKLINQTREKDPKYIFDKFVNKEYNLNDYKEDEIKKKKQLYFVNMEFTYEFLLEFYQVLYDYQLILRYSFLFKDLQELLNKVTTLKDVKKTTIKKLMTTEKDLLKLVKVKKGLLY